MGVTSVVPGIIEVLAAEAGSIASRTSAEIDTRRCSALILTVPLASKAGTVTFTPKLQRLLADGTTWQDYFVAAAALSANGTGVYCIGRGATATVTGGVTESKEIPIPGRTRVVLTYSGAGAGNSFDTRAEVELIP